ncbi:MAG: hypothetical protein E5Y02_21195 [Mesorhizobium sp.]|jgi:hypothetical protein|uniref:Uncharacterized protein n=1 Tax=Mesorhizobium opportunistum (strain LMG 24607 / HAMBI 3007 / WSM2075) TaxID=536019 RepID=F7Y9R4_MESOW|nr:MULTISPECIES: hypothetical protein [Mesorhizobium]TJU93128.1 MAG: hypothetical protein E5Y12_29165 [Mesorhizobium sp.]AEH89853.1 conserved hypothetical protein [Mesorhizobium opportunistum WSM2075]ESY69756.1 hypothetical protein X742_06625 [Mesorhizobium sp. LNHC232B00]ESY81477.1 hypothetical protein X740_10330 [Mesorhizobium sp. LNHC221B00]MCA0029689.1 hypothetical protein [Mesorhizobium sp. B263B2A]
MKTMAMCALALCIGLPAVASAAEADVVIRTHHRHHNNVKIINEYGQRLHHRRHGTVAFYDHGRRHHRRDTVIVTGSVSTYRHHHRHPVVIDNGGY